MKEIRRSTQFKKDFKKYRNQTQKIQQLFFIVQCLQNEVPIPPMYKPHRLVGNYKGYLECHLEDDFLLIWMDESSQVIKLVRLGSHAELFG